MIIRQLSLRLKRKTLADLELWLIFQVIFLASGMHLFTDFCALGFCKCTSLQALASELGLHLNFEPSRNMGFPGGTNGKEPACQCTRRKRPRFDP